MKNDLKKIAKVFYSRAGKMLCLVFSVVFITGCVTTEAENRMQYQINTLETEVKNIKQKSKSIETRFPDQQKQFSKLEDTQHATAKTMSDLLIQIQYLTTEVQMLTGRFEEARYNSEKNSAELRESKEMLLAKMKQLEIRVEDLKKRLVEPAPVAVSKEEPGKTITGVAEKEETEKTGEAVKDKAEQEDKTDVKDAYMAAYEAYKNDKTVEAREKFQSLLMDHPENDYSDNARFWIATSYYKDENYEDAILAYEELFKKNPDSDKVPEAMLKQGLAFYALKDSKTGRIILEKLVDKFPESDQAKLAIKKMKKATVLPKKK
ncbi:tol-pal system protein YbgF [bacterium BMS3Abin09]|nr:tol-pal system protein YbgF [bacterium BMS3Abin09]GBE41777.1 tol-pal system protein YbgF [bacterium BMS3Bbin09]